MMLSSSVKAMRAFTLCALIPAALVSFPLHAEQVHLPNDPSTPLTLSGRGSFYVGGHTIHQTFTEMGSQRAADTATIDQMYVEYMRPEKVTQPPVIMIHGAGQSGSAWDTTPDGRMGWFEHFVRLGYPSYVIDQVGRARSGFNQAIFNNVASGANNPKSQPAIIRPGDEHALWINMRLGPSMGVPYKDTQFPIGSFKALSQMGIPDLSATVPTPNPTFKTLSLLAKSLKGAVLISHSQSGHFPLETALIDPHVIKAMVLIEPGTCENIQLRDEQIRKLAEVPLLVVYGDHLSAPTGLPGKNEGWIQRKDECDALITRFRSMGGHADMFYLPAMGIHGNTHMIMQDKNNLQIADMINGWLHKNIAH